MDKPWWQSKTKWAGIILAASQVAKMFPVTAPYAPILDAIASALGAFGVRDAIRQP